MIHNHITRPYTGIVLERMKHLPPGGKMGDLPSHLQHESFVRTGDKKTGGPNLRLLRLEEDRPSLTVTAYIFNKFVHPIEHRYITPREAACLQDFPEDWAFIGTLGSVHHQVGNAVPVQLATAIASAVARQLLSRNIEGQVSIASYFSGAGGLDLGFELASSPALQFKTNFCTDIDADCGSTIQKNRPDWGFQLADITQLSGQDVLARLGHRPTVVVGGPPCQPFSVAGKQLAMHDPLGKLYRDFVTHVAVLRPEVVVMENVYGLVQVKSSHMLHEIYQAFNGIGYDVCHKELLAADYGTPQLRRRVFFIATKGGQEFKFPPPTHGAEPGLLGIPVYAGAGASFMHLPPPTMLAEELGSSLRRRTTPLRDPDEREGMTL